MLQTVYARPGRVQVQRSLGPTRNVALFQGPGDLKQGLEEGFLREGGGRPPAGEPAAWESQGKERTPLREQGAGREAGFCHHVAL